MSQCTGRHRAQRVVRPSGAPRHTEGGGTASRCCRGSLLVQAAVQVHGDGHGCDLGGQKESQTHGCPPLAQRQPSDGPRLAHREEEEGVPGEEGS